jgi:hypothetical protein
MLKRGSMLALAVVLCAWFAVGIRQTRDLNRATAIVTGQSPPAPAAAAHARSLLSGAGWLNPDTTVDAVRGRLALAQGDNARAQQILGGVVRSEPDNLQAWTSLAASVLPSDRAGLRIAVAHIAQLDPRIK